MVKSLGSRDRLFTLPNCVNRHKLLYLYLGLTFPICKLPYKIVVRKTKMLTHMKHSEQFLPQRA